MLLRERVERQLRLFLSGSESGPGKMIILANEPLLTEESAPEMCFLQRHLSESLLWLLPGVTPARDGPPISPARTVSWSRELAPATAQGGSRE